MKKFLILFLLLCTPANAAIFDWSGGCTQPPKANPNNGRDPTIIYNNVSYIYGGPIGGYTNTQYDFTPINFAPNIALAMCSDGTGPKEACAGTYTQIPLTQFGLPVTTKRVWLLGNVGIEGVNKWNGRIYIWTRKPGSNWSLSPLVNGGYISQVVIPAAVGLVNGTPTIEIAWRAINLNTSNWGTGNSTIDSAWFQAVLEEYCE